MRAGRGTGGRRFTFLLYSCTEIFGATEFRLPVRKTLHWIRAIVPFPHGNPVTRFRRESSFADDRARDIRDCNRENGLKYRRGRKREKQRRVSSSGHFDCYNGIGKLCVLLWIYTLRVSSIETIKLNIRNWEDFKWNHWLSTLNTKK